MSVPDRTITHVSWRDLFPWLCMFRTFSVALSVTVVGFAALATVVTPIGWMVSEFLFLKPDVTQQSASFQEFVEVNRSPYRGVFDSSERLENYGQLFGARLSGARAVFERTTLPFRMLFRGELGTRRFLYLTFGCLWTLLAWSFSGCCICRYALFKLTREETLSIDRIWVFGCRKFLTAAGALLACFGVVALFCLPCFLVGFLLTTNTTAVIGALLWFLVALSAVGIALTLFGTLFGWPLMIASISAENQNVLDAVTRSFAYVYQKPLNYALYGTAALLYGGFCWLIIGYLATTAIDATFWATSWTANLGNPQRISDFMVVETVESQSDPTATALRDTLSRKQPDSNPQTLQLSAKIIRFWNGLISTFAVALLQGLFWCLASAIYLVLRMDVDEVEMDEIFLDEDSRSYPLPPLKSDGVGVPQIQTLEEFTASQGKGSGNAADTLGE